MSSIDCHGIIQGSLSSCEIGENKMNEIEQNHDEIELLEIFADVKEASITPKFKCYREISEDDLELIEKIERKHNEEKH